MITQRMKESRKSGKKEPSPFPKRTTSVVLCLLLIVCALPTFAVATNYTSVFDPWQDFSFDVCMPDGAVTSYVEAEIPDEYGTAYYTMPVCFNIQLSDEIASNATFPVVIRSWWYGLLDYWGMVSKAGFTIDDWNTPGLVESILEDLASECSETAVYNDAEGAYDFEFEVTLEDGDAELILFCNLVDLEGVGETARPLILNFHTESNTSSATHLPSESFENLPSVFDPWQDFSFDVCMPDGAVTSYVEAEIPDEYGTAYYTMPVCFNIQLSDEIASNATFPVVIRSWWYGLLDYWGMVSKAGFTIDDWNTPGLVESILEDLASECSETAVYNDAEGAYDFGFEVTLEDGDAELILFCNLVDLEGVGETARPLILNFHTDSTNQTQPGTPSDPGVNPDPGIDPEPQYEQGGPVLEKAVPACGQLENENALYGLTSNGLMSEYIGEYSTYLIVPNGMETVEITLTFVDSDITVIVNGAAQGALSANNKLTVTLNAASKPFRGTLTDNSKNVIRAIKDNEETVYTIWVVNQRFDDLPDAVVEYLCIGSQYTNGWGTSDYGIRAARSLVGSNYSMGGYASGPVSLGNFGGHIIYYYENAITNDPNNPYGIDFIVFGNAYRGSQEFGEPGQVYVSTDGDIWYALAGGMHYEDYANWEYSITYSRNDNGGTSADVSGNFLNYEYPDSLKYPWYEFSEKDKSSMTFTGICFGSDNAQDSAGSEMARRAGFGYADQGSLGTYLPGESFPTEEFVTIDGATTQMLTEEAYEKLARNIAENPYAEYPSGNSVGRFSVPTDGMDLAWAVDEDGQPVDVSNMAFHYIKIVTATNIVNPSLGEKSTEINMVRIAQANETAVGKTDAPAKITVDGVDVALEDGKFVYDDVPVDGPFKVAVDAPDGANIYINNNCAASANFDAMPLHKIVRVIVQEGEKEPAIYILNLKETASVPAASATLTLDANGGTVNGNATYTFKFDANMSGDPLPEPTAPNNTVTFGGWFMGQRRFDAIPDEIQDTVLTALWVPKETTPTENKITVSFRLIGSTVSEGDVDLADGDYKGAEYVTWIPTTTYTVDENATVADLFLQATEAAGIRSVGADRGYVSTVYAPDVLGGYALSEFTNGPKSGWMYTMDGAHTNAINTQTMHDGAEIVFHYVNDYAWEVSDWGALGGSGWPQLSTEDANYWNKWLEAADVAPYAPPVDPEPYEPTPTEPTPTEPEPEPKKYEDVAEDAWYAGAVDFVSARGLFLGVSETRFGPELPMTRAMLVTVLWRMEGQPAPGAAAAFEDVPADQWYADAVAWAAENGVVKGVGHNRYAPDENVTREQFAAMLYRYAQYKGEGFTGAWYFPLAFDDAAEISDWADEAMHWCVMNGVITGRTESTLVPRGDAKRAEAAAMLERFAGLLEK